MGVDIDEIVRYEGEGTGLDFKRTQYAKAQHEALLKDVLSMANAHIAGDRHIVCGVSAPPGGPREIRGIPAEEVVDAATYQQLVHENIEPDLAVDYAAHTVDGVTVAVLRITSCTERPYAMRKKFQALEHGHMWIRKGTQNMPIRRADLERIYAERAARAATPDLAGAVSLGFDAPGFPAAIAVPTASRAAVEALPSRRAAARIRAILDARRRVAGSAKASVADALARSSLGSLSAMGGPVPYEQRSTETLEANLRKVAETYAEHDTYETFTRLAHPLNLVLRNDGTAHLEAVRVDVEVPVADGVLVAEQEPSEPAEYGPGGIRLSYPILRRFGERGYPSVARDGRVVRLVDDRVGDVRHQTAVPVFAVPVPILLTERAAGCTLPLTCTVHARNLPRPIRRTLTLTVIAADSGPGARPDVEGGPPPAE